MVIDIVSYLSFTMGNINILPSESLSSNHVITKRMW